MAVCLKPSHWFQNSLPHVDGAGGAGLGDGGDGLGDGGDGDGGGGGGDDPHALGAAETSELINFQFKNPRKDELKTYLEDTSCLSSCYTMLESLFGYNLTTVEACYCSNSWTLCNYIFHFVLRVGHQNHGPCLSYVQLHGQPIQQFGQRCFAFRSWTLTIFGRYGTMFLRKRYQWLPIGTYRDTCTPTNGHLRCCFEIGYLRLAMMKK